MAVPRATVVLTVLIGLVTLCLCIVLLAISIPRGLGLADEGLYVYLLRHPATAMPFMDAFVWGKLAGTLHLNLIAIRWLTLALLLLSGAVLCVATLRYVGRNVAQGGQKLLWVFAPVLMLSGVMLFYDGSRPTPSYAFTTIFASNIFAAAVFAIPGRRKWLTAVLLVAAGAMLALSFMARPPSALLLLAWQVLFTILLDKPTASRIWGAPLATAAIAAALLAAAAVGGYDIKNQFVLIRVLTVTSHSLHDLVRIDVPYGLVILASAAAGAFIFTAWRADEDAARKRHGELLLAGLAVAAVAAVAQLWISGDFRPAPVQPDIFFDGLPLKSWGPAIHAVAIGLLLAAAALTGKKRQPHDDADSSAVIVRAALLLYLLCPLSQFGTNTGLWHRSIIDMGPLFLAVALVLWDFCRKGILLPAQMPAVVLLAAIPVLAGIFATQIEHPPGLNGSIWDQSVALERPVFLRGLQVPAAIAGLQRDVEHELRSVGFDEHRDVLLPGIHKIGVVDVIDGRGLGNGWYFGHYESSQAWNCEVAAYGLRQPHRRVFAIEGAAIIGAIRHCIPGLQTGRPAGKWTRELTFDASTEDSRH